MVIGITDSKLDISINDSDFHRRLQCNLTCGKKELRRR